MAPRLVHGSRSYRDVMLLGSAESLPDPSLVALLIGAQDDAVARALLSEHPLPDSFYRLSAEELTSYPGVGPAAAARVLAGLELGRRATVMQRPPRPVISTPEDVVALCGPQLRGLDREHFWALALNTKNQLLKTVEVSVGSLNASIVHPRELYKEAVRLSAASVVVVHNHPSGDPTPSAADIQLTRRLVKAGDVLGIELLDHVVIGDCGGSRSLRDLGLM